MVMRLDAGTVRSMTRATAVLDHFAEPYHDRPEIRLARCPACGHQSRRGRESFVVDGESGDWIHHGGARADGTACRGNVLGLVAAFAGLDIRRDFPRVLEIAASIAGITPDTNAAEVERLCAERQAERRARERRVAEERARGEAMIPALWDARAAPRAWPPAPRPVPARPVRARRSCRRACRVGPASGRTCPAASAAAA
jgi:hypothetical protein